MLVRPHPSSLTATPALPTEHLLCTRNFTLTISSNLTVAPQNQHESHPYLQLRNLGRNYGSRAMLHCSTSSAVPTCLAPHTRLVFGAGRCPLFPGFIKSPSWWGQSPLPLFPGIFLQFKPHHLQQAFPPLPFSELAPLPQF